VVRLCRQIEYPSSQQGGRVEGSDSEREEDRQKEG
jgi:hypothetical protein